MSELSDREEGEIIDDYEYILSSDEENVRQRIQELEEKNYELEQIAQISGVYANAYNASSRDNARYAFLPTDNSSIFSVDIENTLRRSHKSRHKRKHNRRSRSRHRNRYKYVESEDDEARLARLRAKITEELDTIPLDSDTEHCSTTTNKNVELLTHASRAKLRMAVTRNNSNGYKTQTALKERLLKENNLLSTKTKENSNTNHCEEPKQADEDDSLSADEQELRLIALKSAVINKHMARKQRNAAVPYSPTDDLLANDESLAIEENMELEMPDLAVGMDISPVISPAITTPTSPVDMDIAQSDSDVEERKTPTPPPPPPVLSLNGNWHSYSNLEYPAAMHYGIYMPEMQYQQPPPLPPPIPPPPPPAEEATTVVETSIENVAEKEDDEDEEALRALLLQQTKAKEKTKLVSETEQDKIHNDENVENKQIPTAIILKQAVMRLRQNTTQTATEIVERPKIIIRSVSQINRDFEKQQLQAMHEVIEINSTCEEIITLSDSSDEDGESMTAALHNKRALSDINYNVRNRPNLRAIPLCKSLNIPNTEVGQSTCDKTSENISETVLKRKNVGKNKTHKRSKIAQNSDSIKEKEATKQLVDQRNEKQLKNNIENSTINEPVVEKHVETTKTPTVNSTSPALINATNATTEEEEEGSSDKILSATDEHATTTTTTTSILTPEPETNISTNMTPTTSTNRLITTTPKIQVPKIIISINNNSDTDESDINISSSLDADYHNYDNASPISLPMDSPVNGLSRCVSPTNAAAEETNERPPVVRTIVNDIFQQRLDDFLKNARTSLPKSVSTTTTKTTNSIQAKEKSVLATSTPMSLRHLPVSAQQEYRRLMLRMKMLEEQKKQKLVELDGNSKVSTTKLPITAPKNAATFVSANKRTLIKKVLVKNATNTSATGTISKYNYNNKNINKNKQETNSVAKINALQTYEKSYEKLGGVIVLKLDKSLQQVAEARQAKIDKLFYEEKVRQLKLQLRLAQQNLNVAQNKMQQVFPMISGTNQLVTTLKRRRMKLFKAANVLGKSIKGDNYRLKNTAKEDIAKKSEKLALAIKEVNTIKANNIKQIKGTTSTTTTTTTTATKIKACDQATMTEAEIEEKIIKDVSSNQLSINSTEKEKRTKAGNDTQEGHLRPYFTPLSDRDSNIATKLPADAVLCPFDLSGNCQDVNCRHAHLKNICT